MPLFQLALRLKKLCELLLFTHNILSLQNWDLLKPELRPVNRLLLRSELFLNCNLNPQVELPLLHRAQLRRFLQKRLTLYSLPRSKFFL